MPDVRVEVGKWYMHEMPFSKPEPTKIVSEIGDGHWNALIRGKAFRIHDSAVLRELTPAEVASITGESAS